MLLDADSWQERDEGLTSMDPLGFVDTKSYPDRLAAAQLSTGARDAAVRGIGRIGGSVVSMCVMDFAFMGGSMGSVVGEKVTRAAEDALEERLPLIVVSASGRCPHAGGHAGAHAARQARSPRSRDWRTRACPTSAS